MSCRRAVGCSVCRLRRRRRRLVDMLRRPRHRRNLTGPCRHWLRRRCWSCLNQGGLRGLRWARPRRRCRLRDGFAGQCRPAWRGKPDIALDHDVGRTTDEQQVLDVVAPYQHKAPMAVHSRGVHHRQPCLAIPAAGHERAERQAAHKLDGDKNDDEQDQCRERPQQPGRVTRARHAIQPLQHRLPHVATFEFTNTRPLRLATASCLSRFVNSLKHAPYDVIFEVDLPPRPFPY